MTKFAMLVLATLLVSTNAKAALFSFPTGVESHTFYQVAITASDERTCPAGYYNGSSFMGTMDTKIHTTGMTTGLRYSIVEAIPDHLEGVSHYDQNNATVVEQNAREIFENEYCAILKIGLARTTASCWLIGGKVLDRSSEIRVLIKLYGFKLQKVVLSNTAGTQISDVGPSCGR